MSFETKTTSSLSLRVTVPTPLAFILTQSRTLTPPSPIVGRRSPIAGRRSPSIRGLT
ncbi:hypothetical protein P8452_76615 [Trifolium repens]|nr:hypothetical protein P8452_76615 [Trifolium repens]